eukprot:2059516-Prymnesium_polylepis.1
MTVGGGDAGGDANGGGFDGGDKGSGGGNTRSSAHATSSCIAPLTPSIAVLPTSTPTSPEHNASELGFSLVGTQM